MNHLSDELLNEYLDFALAPGVLAAVEAHLAVCPECAERLGEWQALFLQIGSLPELVPDVDFAPLILADLKPRAHLPYPLWWLAALQTTAIILMLILAWPLAQRVLPASFYSGFPSFSALPIFSARASSLWQALVANLRPPHFPPAFSGLDLPTLPLVLTVVGLSLLWLACNSLFFLPFSRRQP